MPQQAIDDACQLVKHNSIEGCKLNKVDVVYTMWTNLKKTPSMEVGQISFHNENEVIIEFPLNGSLSIVYVIYALNVGAKSKSRKTNGNSEKAEEDAD